MQGRAALSAFILWIAVAGLRPAVAAQKTFQVPPPAAVGVEAEGVACGDVDRDGDQDLAIASSGDGTISILRNDGDGNFSLAMTDRAGQRPRHLLLEDIDLDGDLDLLVANLNSANVSVLVNRGDAFSSRLNFVTGPNPQSLATGDLDGDRDLDLVVANGTSGIANVLRNVGGTAFEIVNTLYLDGEIGSVAIGDLDGDLDADVVATNRSFGVVHVALNQGGWAFTTSLAFKTAPRPTALALADLDGDADLDVAAVHTSAAVVTILLNGGSGTLGRPVYYPTGNSSAPGRMVKCGDADGDGDADLLVVNGPTGGATLSLLLNTGAGTFGPALNIPISQDGANLLPLYDAVFARLDRDDALDIAGIGHTLTAGFSGVIRAFQETGRSRFEMPQTLPSGKRPVALVAADLNGDVRPDLAVVAEEDGGLAVHLNGGRGSFVAPRSCSAGLMPVAITAGDFDQDGDIDLATVDTHPSKNDVTVIRNDGTATFVPDAPIPLAGAFAVGVGQLLGADLDGDHDLDLVTANSETNRISVLLNQRPDGFLTATSYAAATHPSDAAAGDLDADGDVDLLVVGEGNHVALLRNRGDASFEAPVPVPLAFTPASVAIADLDGDGALDFAVAPRSACAAAFGRNTGSETFAVNNIYAGTAMGWNQVLAADVEGDGDMDLVFANPSCGTVALLENEGLGVFARPVHYVGGVEPRGLAAADFDGDGDLDLALTNSGSGEVSTLYNTTRVVPVLLSAFTAAASASGGVLLTWRVEADEELHGFRLERRSDVSNTVTVLDLQPSARDFEDQSVRPGTRYRYVLVAMGRGIALARTPEVEVITRGLHLQLEPAAPNPCREQTMLRLALPATSPVELAVYDARGKLVATLVDGILPGGMHAFPWNGRSRDGAPVAAGVYLCRLRASAGTFTQKIVVARP